jgi:hypothetical protein
MKSFVDEFVRPKHAHHGLAVVGTDDKNKDVGYAAIPPLASAAIAADTNAVNPLARSEFSASGLREHAATPGDEGLADYYIVSSENTPVQSEGEEENENASTGPAAMPHCSAIPTMGRDFVVR